MQYISAAIVHRDSFRAVLRAHAHEMEAPLSQQLNGLDDHRLFEHFTIENWACGGFLQRLIVWLGIFGSGRGWHDGKRTSTGSSREGFNKGAAGRFHAGGLAGKACCVEVIEIGARTSARSNARILLCPGLDRRLCRTSNAAAD